MTSVLPVAGEVLFGLLALAMVMAFIRLARGPSLADRVVALDLITAIGVAICGVAAVSYRQPVLLDVAIVLALISFVGTVAFARFIKARPATGSEESGNGDG